MRTIHALGTYRRNAGVCPFSGLVRLKSFCQYPRVRQIQAFQAGQGQQVRHRKGGLGQKQEAARRWGQGGWLSVDIGKYLVDRICICPRERYRRGSRLRHGGVTGGASAAIFLIS